MSSSIIGRSTVGIVESVLSWFAVVITGPFQTGHSPGPVRHLTQTIPQAPTITSLPGADTSRREVVPGFVETEVGVIRVERLV